jgi:hypothetical protein
MRKNCIPAFSIVEATVSMVVMAIIIGIVFVIFEIMSERMLDFKSQNEKVTDLNRLTYCISKDIFENRKMTSTDEEALIFLSYSGDVTKYIKHQEFLLRSRDEFTDTFRIAARELKFDTLSNGRGIVFQRLTMDVDIDKLPASLKFFKKLYANDLIKPIKE